MEEQKGKIEIRTETAEIILFMTMHELRELIDTAGKVILEMMQNDTLHHIQCPVCGHINHLRESYATTDVLSGEMYFVCSHCNTKIKKEKKDDNEKD